MKRPVRFLPEEEYVESFTKRGMPVPPFIVFQPFVIRDGIGGYLVPCTPEWEECEEYEDPITKMELRDANKDNDLDLH